MLQTEEQIHPFHISQLECEILNIIKVLGHLYIGVYKARTGKIIFFSNFQSSIPTIAFPSLSAFTNIITYDEHQSSLIDLQS